MVTAVSAAHTTVSIMTAWNRFTLSPTACRVRPEEYSTTELIANSCTMTTMR